MKNLVPTLSILALAGAFPAGLAAVDVKDDGAGLKVGVKGNVQARVSFLNSATVDAADTSKYEDDSWDPIRGSKGEAEFARFSIRRARLAFEASYKDNWKGNITFRADKAGTSSSAGVNAELYYAWAAYVLKTGDFGHEFKLGLDKPFNNESSISSSSYILPNDREVSARLDNRGVGLAYKLSGPFFNIGVDWQNNRTASKASAAGDNQGNETTNGSFVSFRVEASPGASLFIPKKMESYAGTEVPAGILIGFDFQKETGRIDSGLKIPVYDSILDDVVQTTFAYSDREVTTWGPDILGRFKGLTALAEIRWRHSEIEGVNNFSNAHIGYRSIFWNIQAAYAFPLENGIVIEPALRYTEVDDDISDDLADETKPFAYDNKALWETYTYKSGAENGSSSGRQVDVGLNLYWKGHASKTQLAYQRWTAEVGDAKASIVTLQHQISF